MNSKIPKKIEDEVREATKVLVAFFLAFGDAEDLNTRMKMIGVNAGDKSFTGEKYIEISLRQIPKEEVMELQEKEFGNEECEAEVLFQNEEMMPKKEDYKQRLS